MTIHTAQGITSREHILALPAGSRAIDGKMGYSGNTRHRVQSFLLVNEAAEREAVRADSDEGGHLFQSDPGHHSNLMAAR
jgi:hypothetical protein